MSKLISHFLFLTAIVILIAMAERSVQLVALSLFLGSAYIKSEDWRHW